MSCPRHMKNDFDLGQENELQQLLAPLGPEGQRIAFAHLPAVFAPLLAEIKKINPIIAIIAGTNGKGETIYRLQQTLAQQGWKTAMWISPHILSLRERMTLGNALISYAQLQQVLRQTRATLALSPAGKSLSYYEFLFYAFLQAVIDYRPQVLLLEVGLGGRLDAVNLFDAELCVLTSISRDHQAFLGTTYRAILQEKLGVTRPGQNVISALELKYLRQLMQPQATREHWQWHDLFEENILQQDDLYPKRNAALAAAAAKVVQELGKNRWAIVTAPSGESHQGPAADGSLPFGLAWPGRREGWPKIKGHQDFRATPEDRSLAEYEQLDRWLFIGGHNVDGLRKMMAYLAQEKIKVTTILASFSQRPYDDLKTNLALLGLMPGHPRIILAAFNHPKAVDQITLQNLARDVCLAVPIKVECWHQQLEENLNHEAGTTLVTGSFYFVGLVQRSLLHQYGRGFGVCPGRSDSGDFR